MVGITEATAALQALQATKELLSAMVGVRDAAAFNAKAGELQAKIIETQAAVMAAYEERTAAVQRVGELEREIAGFERWEAEKQRYELHKLSHSGVLVYRLKSDAEGQEPAHDICATCYQHRKKSILQAELRAPGRVQILKCHECGSEVLVSGMLSQQAPPQPPRRR